MAKETDYERGKREGRTDALVEQHTLHLAKINGSMERFAVATEDLTNEIRTLKEESRSDRDKVKTTAEVLAKETERRKVDLEDKVSTGDRKFSKRERFVGAGLTVLGLLIALYLGLRQ